MAFELPEAFTVARQMDREIRGKTIASLQISETCASLIRQGFINLNQVDLANRTVASVHSQGKWIFINLQPEFFLLFALETGGKLLYHPDVSSLPSKYNVKVEFTDGSCLIEAITGWGWAKAFNAQELALQRYPGRQGPSPDTEEFTYPYFCHVLDASPKKNVKFILIQQDQIAGLGNGYLQDILFKAKIHPARKAGEIGEQEQLELYRAIREVTLEAIHLGGSQFEVDLFDHPGGYHRLMGEHMKGQPCPVCKTTVQKITVLGSSSYICPVCQV
jgi:formamidopyrimidine-DNA glycosylase